MNRKAFLDAIWHGQDPFAAVPTNLYQKDLQGWRSVHEYLLYSIDNLRPAAICEIGVWKGASTVSMASRLRDNGIEGTIVSVDTWLGSVEHWHVKTSFDDLSMDGGYPSLYKKFLNNVKSEGLSEYVVPLPLDSLNAAALIATLGIKFDIIHLDAGHDYASVNADLEAWWPCLREGGIFVGDDYDPENKSFPGVLRAFDEFFGRRGLGNFKSLGGKCIIEKP